MPSAAHSTTHPSNQPTKVRELEEKLFAAETTRRKMHNTIQELKGNVRVCVRARPAKKKKKKRRKEGEEGVSGGEEGDETEPVGVSVVGEGEGAEGCVCMIGWGVTVGFGLFHLFLSLSLALFVIRGATNSGSCLCITKQSKAKQRKATQSKAKQCNALNNKLTTNND